MSTKKELLAELKALKAEKAALTSPVSVNTGECAFVLRDNVENTEKYDARYTFINITDNKGAKLAQVRGNSAAEALLAMVQGIVYGTQGKGGARWNKAHKAHSLLESEIPQSIRALCIKSKTIAGEYTA